MDKKKEIVDKRNDLLKKSGYYEIRLESIGGLGANLCGKMLGELGVKYLDMNAVSFSSYGSEKTGTPVKGFIRYCEKDKEIRAHSPVEKPHLLVIFHQALLQDESVFAGCSKDTTVLIATEEGQDFSGFSFPCEIGSCYVVPAQKIAMETHSRINVVMLGAVAAVSGLDFLSEAQWICRDTLGKKYPEMLECNLEGVRRGYAEVKPVFNTAAGRTEKEIQKEKTPAKEVESKKEQNSGEKQQGHNAKWGYDTAPIGGINPCFGNTVTSDVSPSRQGYIPLFIKERCINCGLCDSTCPDMVFQFKKGEYRGKEMMVNQGLDYYHCKGCLRCVEVCPVNALVRGLEAEHPQKDYFLPNQDLVRTPEYYQKAGPDGYITSESYLTEKRVEGGEV